MTEFSQDLPLYKSHLRMTWRRLLFKKIMLCEWFNYQWHTSVSISHYHGARISYIRYIHFTRTLRQYLKCAGNIIDNGLDSSEIKNDITHEYRRVISIENRYLLNRYKSDDDIEGQTNEQVHKYLTLSNLN